jgi:DNA invertase Pin-like site-specific DNA recombinase
MARRRTVPASDVGAKLPEMVGAVIYVRVSTKEQTENLSLPTQLRACEEYCRRHGFEILHRFQEQGESAKTTDRSELQNLLKYCRTHKGKVHFVIVYNLTRFAREKYDHFALRAHLKSLGISLRSATEPIDDTSTGKLMEGVLAAFAQFDNDVRSDRTRAGMRAALELGRWTFPAPLGYLNAPKWSGKSLVHDPERAQLVKSAFEDLATGRYTKQEVIARATAAGLRSRKGLMLSPQSFGQMMRNPIYIGKIDSPDYGISTKDRILHVWEQRRAEANERTTEQERRVKVIQQKLDRLDEAFLYSESIDLTSYSRQRDKLREELTLAKIEHHTEAVDELDVQGILAFAERILPRASDLWVQSVARLQTASAVAVLSGRDRVRRKSVQSNRRNRTAFQLLGAVREC